MKEQPTRNYEQFQVMRDNREVSQANVERLKNSIKEIGFINARPIIVNRKMEILDGMHRFYALKELGLPIVYEVVDTSSHRHDEKVVKELNTNQSVWQLKDWVHRHAVHGKQFYKEVERFRDMYKVDMSSALVICCHETVRGNDIREGVDMRLNNKRIPTMEFLLAHKELPYWKSKKFVYAVTQMFKKCTAEQIMKVEKKIWSVPQQATSGQYLTIFENIINRHVAPEKHITLFNAAA